MAVYGYARVSTLRQADEGESLAVQNRQIINYAALHGFTLDQVFIERGVSGSTSLSERSEGQLLLKTLKPGDCVITPKLDRMFRSAIDALGILAHLIHGIEYFAWIFPFLWFGRAGSHRVEAVSF